MKKTIVTAKAPAAIGPYSQAVEINGWIFVSGQIPLDLNGQLIEEQDIRSQTQTVIRNIEAILSEAGYSLSNVVKTTCYLADINMFGDMNEVYSEYFGKNKPARSTVEVSRFPKDVLIEIDAIAAKED